MKNRVDHRRIANRCVGVTAFVLATACGGPVTTPVQDEINTVTNIWTSVGYQVLDASGEPEEGVHVDFETLGLLPLGVELLLTEATTNEFGLASTLARASTPNSFRVRANVEDRAPADVTIHVDLPSPSHFVYFPCEVGEGCREGEACVPLTTETTSGAQCTVSCTSNDECPNGSCVTVGLSSYCAENCTADFECGGTNLCVPVTDDSGTAHQLCAPNNFSR